MMRSTQVRLRLATVGAAVTLLAGLVPATIELLDDGDVAPPAVVPASETSAPAAVRGATAGAELKPAPKRPRDRPGGPRRRDER